MRVNTTSQLIDGGATPVFIYTLNSYSLHASRTKTTQAPFDIVTTSISFATSQLIDGGATPVFIYTLNSYSLHASRTKTTQAPFDPFNTFTTSIQ